MTPQVVTAQMFSITDQLSCLGVRGLELDLHYSESVVGARFFGGAATVKWP